MMESLFYCTPRRVALPTLTERLVAKGLIDRVDDRRPMTALVYRGTLWFSLHESPRADWEMFEEPQVRVLRACGTQSVFQIDCRASLLDAIRPHVCEMIRAFDGWIGLDDGEFATQLTLGDLEQPEGLSRRVVAMTDEDECDVRA
jgi:hypothetical protein